MYTVCIHISKMLSSILLSSRKRNDCRDPWSIFLMVFQIVNICAQLSRWKCVCTISRSAPFYFASDDFTYATEHWYIQKVVFAYCISRSVSSSFFASFLSSFTSDLYITFCIKRLNLIRSPIHFSLPWH